MEVSSSSTAFKTFWKTLFQPKNKGAILILAWSFFAVNVFGYFTISNESDLIKRKANLHSEEIVAIISIFLPIGGWLADAYFGRYKVIVCGMWIMWIGAMLNGISLVTSMVVVSYKEHGHPWISIGFKAIMGAGFGVFQANIIQFGIDQLLDASSKEITSFITWYTVTVFTSCTVMFISTHCTPDYAAVLVLTVCLSLALCSNFIFNHWLVKENIINNPLPQIRKVVQYTIRNRRQLHRIPSSEEHEDRGALSRFNIAKAIYAGPFTTEQVEDVKTFFRIMGIIAIFMIACSGITSIYTARNQIVQHLHNWPVSCYKQLNILWLSTNFILAVVLGYKLIIQPLLLPKINLSITTKFIIAVFFHLMSIIALLGIESISYHYRVEKNQNVSRCLLSNSDGSQVDINVYWITIPGAMNGISLFVFFLSGIEFICAQAPFNMKGTIFGLAYPLYGLGTLIQSVLSIPFLNKKQSAWWERAPLTCGIWYFIIQMVIVTTSFIAVLVLIKRYRQRERNNAILKHSDTQTDW